MKHQKKAEKEGPQRTIVRIVVHTIEILFLSVHQRILFWAF